MTGLLIGLIIGFILGEHNEKLRFFYVGSRKAKRAKTTTQDIVCGWKK